MIYKESMTIDFFGVDFMSPALGAPHVIIMDNASFHPKPILDELYIKDKHFSYLYQLIRRFESYWASLGYLEKKESEGFIKKVQYFLNICLFLKLNDYNYKMWFWDLKWLKAVAQQFLL